MAGPPEGLTRPGTDTGDLLLPTTAQAQAQGQAGRDKVGSSLAWSAARRLGGQAATFTLSNGPDAQMFVESSDPLAESAERLCVAAGGPGLDALTTGHPVMAPYTEFTGRWPAYAAYLQVDTPYRSVLAVPVHQVAVLTIYFTDHARALAVDVETARTVARSIWETALRTPLDERRVLLIGAVERRHTVWVATGILMEALRVPVADASDLLRTRARSEGRAVEDVATDLYTGKFSTDTFRT